MTGLFLLIIASLMYGALGFHFWRSRWRRAPAQGTPRPAAAAPWEKAAILPPLLVHGVTLYHSLFAGAGLNLGVGNAVSAIAWLTVLIYWLSSFYYNLEGMQALVLPGAAVCALFPAVFPEVAPVAYTELPAFKFHLSIAMLAYSLFTIAAVHAVLMMLVERHLHSGTLPAALTNLPPLMTMENLLFRLITGGFVLLTLTLVSGAFFSEQIFGKPLPLNHKTIFAILSWGVYGALLGGRAFYGWRGRTAVRWSLSGFVILLLAYVGSKFVLEVILHRPG